MYVQLQLVRFIYLSAIGINDKSLMNMGEFIGNQWYCICG